MQIFTKQNNTNYKNSLIKEKEGLLLLQEALKDNPYLKIPKIFNADEKTLKIEKIDSYQSSKELSRDLGMGLGILHKKAYDSYGLDNDNYIGLNPQKNILSKNWGEFFINYRLLSQVELIRDQNIKKEFRSILQNSRKKLESFLNENCGHPSLLHGDLWSGNVLYSKKSVYLIDPAVYYGDREADIAMTQMFGGFSKEFYESYSEIYSLSKLYGEKKIIYNLYHYLNHYNLFGGSYFYDCREGFEFIEKGL